MSKTNDEHEEQMAPQPFGFYLKPDVSFKIISTKWGTFTLLGLVIYIYHLCWAVGSIDKYADITRLYACGGNPYGEESSAVFDQALLLVSIFHIIEWLRQTIFLVGALVGVNLISAFYVFSLNVPYGFVAMIIALIVRNSESGTDCAMVVEDGSSPKQAERANVLALQLVCLLIYIPTSFAHILFFKIKGIEWLHEQYLAEEEGDD